MATRVEVVYYSCAPDTALRERLHTALQEEAGARAAIRDGARLEYGDSVERVALPESPAPPGLLVLVFPLAQTPEAEVHGEFIERLRERLDPRRLGAPRGPGGGDVPAARRVGGPGARAAGDVGAPPARSAADRERPRVSAMTTVTLSLISHTNVGKTTLARTLLRREIGEVRDEPHVTTLAEAHRLIEADGARLLLWDTPGFGDTVRLMTRLRLEKNPIGWFLHQAWDRVLDRALWCSQEAVRNVRQESDVVLYLVNATEDPEAAGYLRHELELLSWMNRPVLVVLNQVGVDDAARTLETWRRHLAPFAVVRDVLALDAFSRAWAEESLLLERVVDLLEGDKRAAMTRLVRRGMPATWASSTPRSTRSRRTWPGSPSTASRSGRRPARAPRGCGSASPISGPSPGPNASAPWARCSTACRRRPGG